MCDRRIESEIFQPNFRLLAGLLVIYYIIFLYDLFSVGDIDSENLDYSHATRREDDGGGSASLELVYVCHHWTRAFGSVLRNVLVAFCWQLDDEVAVKHPRSCCQLPRAGMHKKAPLLIV